ncbi:unnamed protein product [Ilex paraguariensis]|uniref:Disease resistance protein At4g27190-like leucine-rich repeats domain-containing protein n=1 Tax=Ilex paraguariensis TaxID=185542 RepID=A0ABC8RTI8_9AQUA
MDYLKQICVGQLPPGSLGKLKFLEIQQCIDLMDVLLPSNLLQRLQNLEVISLSTNSLKDIFPSEGIEGGQIVLQKLRELKLDNLPELTKIWNGPHLAIFQNLQILTVIKCKKLRNLFKWTVAMFLVQLEDVWVQDCSALEGIIGMDEVIEADKIIFPKLKNLLLQNLPCLTSFYPGNGTIECPSLEHLHLHDCPLFRTSVSDFNSSKDIQVNNEQHSLLLKKRLS